MANSKRTRYLVVGENYDKPDLFEYIKKCKSKIVQEALKEHKEKHAYPRQSSSSSPAADIS